MRSGLCLLALVFAIVISGAVGSDGAVSPTGRHNRTRPGSFAPYRADSVEKLVDEIASDKVLSSRYARHFGTTGEAVMLYFRNNLKLMDLEKTEKVTAHFVSRGGRIIARTCILPKGTRVFATSDNIPILDWCCGNPLTTRLPSRPKPTVTTKAPAPEVKVAASEQETVLPPVMTPEPVQMASVPVTMVPTLVPLEETVAALPVALPPILGAIAPLLAGAVSVQHHSQPVAVPEPSALLALGMGLSSALVLHRARRRRN